MALQAPQQQRQIPHAGLSQQPQRVSVPSPQRKRPLEDSQEWVLFSPAGAFSTTQTQTTSTERTPKTPGRSRISDFGSLDTAARSQGDDKDDDDITCQGTEIDEEDNEELDSLDDGLHAFHEPPEGSGLYQRLYQSGSILPTHDGLGAFRASASPVQEQLWHYERYNPRRKHVRRRSSVQRRLDVLEDADGLHKENEKNQWIEKWRMEQSKALLEEIERETRRQRRTSRQSTTRSSVDTMAEDQASMSAPSMEEVLTRPDSSQGSTPQMESESIWRRVTRHVIHDIMGIDEDILSVIFGETLPKNAVTAPDISRPEEQEEDLNEVNSLADDTWQHRLLQRIARELGFLIYHISEHPGAFSTYLRTQESPPYAGIPTSSTPENKSIQPNPIDTNTASLSNPSAAPFAPTLQRPSHAADTSVWGIDVDLSIDPLSLPHSSHSLPNIAEEPLNPTTSAVPQEREYWERELDVKMVFNYLRRRFSRAGSPSPPTADQSPPAPSPPAPRRDSAISQPESRRRAALIRRHHPLTSRSAAAESRRSERSYLLHHHHHHHHHHQYGYGHGYGVAGVKRPGSSSCASQSTRSKKSLSRQSGAGSGRNYWDLGGSVGSAGIGSDAGVV